MSILFINYQRENAIKIVIKEHRLYIFQFKSYVPVSHSRHAFFMHHYHQPIAVHNKVNFFPGKLDKGRSRTRIRKQMPILR